MSGYSLSINGVKEVMMSPRQNSEEKDNSSSHGSDISEIHSEAEMLKKRSHPHHNKHDLAHAHHAPHVAEIAGMQGTRGLGKKKLKKN